MGNIRVVRLVAILSFIGLLQGCAVISNVENVAGVTEQDINPKGTIVNEDGILVFVGERIAVFQREYDCPSDSICMDGHYVARYRIIEILQGDYDGDTIDFFANDHYGMPKFSKHKAVLLYLQQHNKNIGHMKYEYNIVNPLRDGGWGICTDIYEYYDYSEIPKTQRAVKQNLRFSRFRDGVDFGQAKCRNGYLASDAISLTLANNEGRTPAGLVLGWMD